MTREQILARLIQLDEALLRLQMGQLPKPEPQPPPTAKVLPFRR